MLRSFGGPFFPRLLRLKSYISSSPRIFCNEVLSVDAEPVHYIRPVEGEAGGPRRPVEE